MTMFSSGSSCQSFRSPWPEHPKQSNPLVTNPQYHELVNVSSFCSFKTVVMLEAHAELRLLSKLLGLDCHESELAASIPPSSPF